MATQARISSSRIDSPILGVCIPHSPEKKEHLQKQQQQQASSTPNSLSKAVVARPVRTIAIVDEPVYRLSAAEAEAFLAQCYASGVRYRNRHGRAVPFWTLDFYT